MTDVWAGSVKCSNLQSIMCHVDLNKQIESSKKLNALLNKIGRKITALTSQ